MKLTAARSLALAWAACAAAFALRDVAARRDVDLAAAAEPWRPFADAAVGEPDEGGAPEPEPWVLLAPRHRETSPSPPIVVLTPGYDGPIRLSVRLTDGRAAAWSTPARTAPWPAALTPVEVGVAARILAEGPGGRATASFVRVETPGPEAFADPLSFGLPARALIAPRSGADRTEAALRAGLPSGPSWSRGRSPATIRRPGR